MILALVRSMRPRQWIKNLLVLAALVFSKHLLDPPEVLRSLAAFVVFCLLSGAVYVINDLVDREADRLHPKKKLRPIAAGRLRPGPALAGGVVIVIGALAASALLDLRFAAVAAGYFVMQLAYSLRLKQLVVLDVMVVAVGFALRAVAGTFVINVELSPWLFVVTILLALFVAVAKRRHELVNLEGGGISHRSVLGKYSETLLDQMIAVATSSTVVAYCLYTIAPETTAKFGSRSLIFTFPFVLYGVYRYLYLVYRKELGGAPEKVFLTDLPMIIDILLWAVVVVVVLYVRL
ncbi:MAG: decaprenyl-phosphate phosphoribosyltransferase [bacterium]